MNEQNPLPGRITHRLNLDSEEEQKRQQQQRLERQEYERQKQQKRKRKQQKRKAKQQQERAVKQAAQKQAENRKKELEIYNGRDKLNQPDSDSGVSFTRIKRKIQEMYPKFSKKKQRNQSSDDDDDEQQDGEQDQEQSDGQSDSGQDSDEQQEDSSNVKKNKKAKKVERKRQRQQDSDERQQRKKAKSSVKVEPEMSAKDKLVQQVAVRWNYALPEWPPADYDYEGELKKKGFRLVEFSKFKFVDEVVDGLVKVYDLDGYKGVYRGKMGLIDVRPKDDCPSLNYFYSKSQEQLNKILKKALEKQLELLQDIQYKQRAEQKLIEDLKRRLKELSR